MCIRDRHEGLVHVPHVDGDDGRGRVPRLEAEVVEHTFGIAGIGPKLFQALRLVLNQFQCGNHGSGVCWRNTGAEDERPGVVFQPIGLSLIHI